MLERVGAQELLRARAMDRAGRSIEKVKVEWKSLDEDIVSVETSGVITAHRSGEGHVRAFVGKLRADAVVRVAVVGNIEVEPNGIQMGTGVTRRFSAKVLDDRGQPLLGVGGVSWATSDKKIATVDAEGNVTTVEEGEVRVVARAKGVEGAALLFVKTGL